MPDYAHLAILKMGVNVWNNWRKENPEIIPRLKNADLHFVDLGGANLSEAYLAFADLREAYLEGADLNRAILIGADLSEAYLSGANLYQADLLGAYLRGVEFLGSDLREADLGGTYLRHAMLIEANLHAADLKQADLREAELNRAILIGTDLRQADLSGAHLAHTILLDLDLSNVQGLADIEHFAPSSLSIDTLYKSGGCIPEVFLRGCGVPDTMIKFTRSLVEKDNDFYSCFISYSTADEDFAKMLYDTLQGAGIRCWFAPEQILPGERIEEAIDHGIRYWDKVLFCASKSSLTEKWWVDFEVDKAFKKSRDLQRKRGEKVGVVIPLNLDGYLFSDEYQLDPKRSILETTLAADFVGWKSDLDKYNHEIKKVIRALQTDGGKEEPPEPKL